MSVANASNTDQLIYNASTHNIKNERNNIQYSDRKKVQTMKEEKEGMQVKQPACN